MPRVHAVTLFEHTGNKTTKLTWYFFEKAGDELPLHQHDDFCHASVAIEGKFTVFNDEGNALPLSDRNCVEFPKSRKHGIRAETDNAVLLAINEPGLPEA